MKKNLVIATILILLVFSAPVFAADMTLKPADDGFGGGTYFTSQTPAGLTDTKPGTDFSAEEASKIEPAAGVDNVFTLPEDPAAAPVQASGNTLAAPDKPMVPGMTVSKPAR